MKNVSPKSKTIFAAALLCVFIVSAAWQFPKPNKGANPMQQRGNADTSEPGADDNGKNIDMREFDKSMKALDMQMKDLDVQMKELKPQIEKATKDAMENIDWKKITGESEHAMQKAQKEIAQIDLSKIQQETEDAVKNIDWKKMQENINASIKDAQQAVANVNEEKIEQKMKELQDKMQSKEFQQQFNEENIEKAMQKAKQSMEKAKVEMQQWRAFSDALAKDGLIDKTKPYSIELKDGTLFINGKQQSKETTEKYDRYYDGRKNFSIKMSGSKDEDESKEIDDEKDND